MKTERRHELQTNELAIWLATWIEKIKPYFKAIVGSLVLIATVSFAVAYVNNRSQEGLAAAWTDYFNAFATGDPTELEKVSKMFPNTSPAMWALQSAGDAELAEGSGKLFNDRAAARDQLANARDAYEKIVQSTSDKMLKPRALFGLGQSLEALGDFQGAEKQYQEIVTGAQKGGPFEGSVLAELAKHRLESLKQPATRDWYNWFAQQKPVQTPLSDPGLFNDLPNLPDQPDLKLPMPGQLIPGTGTTGAATDLLLPDDAADENGTEENRGPQLFDPPAVESPDSQLDPDATPPTPSTVEDATIENTSIENEIIDTDLIDSEAIETDAIETEVPDSDTSSSGAP